MEEKEFKKIIDTGETEKKFGLKQISIMIKILPIISMRSKDIPQIKSFINDFYLWLETKIDRPIEQKERLNFVAGIADFYQTDCQTQERINAMNYLFKLNFLNQ